MGLPSAREGCPQPNINSANSLFCNMKAKKLRKEEYVVRVKPKSTNIAHKKINEKCNVSRKLDLILLE